MIVCEICKREFTTYKGIGQHILKHNMTSKEYYDKYYKTLNEDICNLKDCNNKTSFLNTNLGYRKYCCEEHSYHCPDNISNRKLKMGDMYKSKEYRQNLSVGIKKFWTSENGTKIKEDYSKNRKYKKRPEISIMQKERFKDAEVLSKHIISINDPEVKERRSISMQKAWQDPEVRERYRVGRQTEKVKESHKKTRERLLNGGAAYMRSFIASPSKPQVELFNIIKTIFSTAILEYKILNYNVDIAIPQLKIAIEFDGSYWHQNKKHDNKRQTEIEKLGWQFIRYYDNVPNKSSIIKDMNSYLFQ